MLKQKILEYLSMDESSSDAPSAPSKNCAINCNYVTMKSASYKRGLPNMVMVILMPEFAIVVLRMILMTALMLSFSIECSAR